MRILPGLRRHCDEQLGDEDKIGAGEGLIVGLDGQDVHAGDEIGDVIAQVDRFGRARSCGSAGAAAGFVTGGGRLVAGS